MDSDAGRFPAGDRAAAFVSAIGAVVPTISAEK
jgi:hypothetical protein